MGRRWTRLLITTTRREVSPFALDCGLLELLCIVGCLVAWNQRCLLCLFVGLSIAEQPFGGDAGLEGERTNLHVPFGG